MLEKSTAEREYTNMGDMYVCMYEVCMYITDTVIEETTAAYHRHVYVFAVCACMHHLIHTPPMRRKLKAKLSKCSCMHVCMYVYMYIV